MEKMRIKKICPKCWVLKKMFAFCHGIHYKQVPDRLIPWPWHGRHVNNFSSSALVFHNNDVIMSTVAFQITSLTIVYSSFYSDADQRTHQSSASLAFVREIHRWPVHSPQKGLVTRKLLPFDDVIMIAHGDQKRDIKYIPLERWIVMLGFV